MGCVTLGVSLWASIVTGQLVDCHFGGTGRRYSPAHPTDYQA